MVRRTGEAFIELSSDENRRLTRSTTKRRGPTAPVVLFAKRRRAKTSSVQSTQDDAPTQVDSARVVQAIVAASDSLSRMVTTLENLNEKADMITTLLKDHSSTSKEDVLLHLSQAASSLLKRNRLVATNQPGTILLDSSHSAAGQDQTLVSETNLSDSATAVLSETSILSYAEPHSASTSGESLADTVLPVVEDPSIAPESEATADHEETLTVAIVNPVAGSTSSPTMLADVQLGEEDEGQNPPIENHQQEVETSEAMGEEEDEEREHVEEHVQLSSTSGDESRCKVQPPDDDDDGDDGSDNGN